MSTQTENIGLEILSDVAVSPNLAQGDQACACVFTQTAVSAHGEVFLSYRRGPGKHGPDGAFVVQRSADQGTTWGEPVTVCAPTEGKIPTSVLCGGIATSGNALLAAFTVVELRRTDVYVFSEEARDFPLHTYVSRSEDGAATWSAPREIATGTLHRPTAGGNVFAMEGGGICIPIENMLRGGPQATAAVFTSDLGRTVSDPVVFAADPEERVSLCDARFARLSGGGFLMHLWTFVHEGEQTLAIHQSRSSDGRSWSRPVPLAIHGQISAPLQLPSGLVIAVNNHRQFPEGSQLWWSRDGGRIWNRNPIQMWDPGRSRMIGEPAAERVTSARENVWDELQRFSFGSPGLVLLDDGTALLSYFATVGGVLHARACRFRVRG